MDPGGLAKHHTDPELLTSWLSREGEINSCLTQSTVLSSLYCLQQPKKLQVFQKENGEFGGGSANTQDEGKMHETGCT